jgi:hypothetical protein
MTTTQALTEPSSAGPIPDPLTDFDDAALAKLKKRAWYAAANAWDEYRRVSGIDANWSIADIAYDEATTAEAWWKTLRDAERQRQAQR